MRLPGPDEGGIRRVSLHRLGGLLERRRVPPAQAGADGTGSRILERKVGGTLHLPFAPVRAAFNAAELGMDVALFVTQDRLQDALATLDHLNSATLHRVPVEVVEAPTERQVEDG